MMSNPSSRSTKFAYPRFALGVELFVLIADYQTITDPRSPAGLPRAAEPQSATSSR